MLLKTRRLSAGRSLQLLLLALAITLTANAGGNSDIQARFDKLGHRIMCPCGCNELLGECNHVGCPDSDGMRNQLLASIQHGDSDDTIFRGFQQEYGPTALAAPMFTGFNRMSWFVPPVLLLLGIGGVLALVRRWKPQAAPMPAPSTAPGFDAVRDRIRRETEL